MAVSTAKIMPVNRTALSALGKLLEPKINSGLTIKALPVNPIIQKNRSYLEYGSFKTKHAITENKMG